MGRVRRVDAQGVVHEPFEHGGRDDPHALHHAVPHLMPGAEERPHELPPGVDLARGDVEGDPAAVERRGAALMRSSAETVIEGVEANGSAYIFRRALDVLDAWGRVEPEARGEANERLREAAVTAARRVVDELGALLASDPARQRRTP